MTERKADADFDIVGKIVSLLQGLDKENQIHILKTVDMWLRIHEHTTGPEGARPEPAQIAPFPTTIDRQAPRFSEREVMSPKDFLMEKDPRTDMERVACLAYYLTHYRETTHFRNLDISKLNTEAAQPKFTNAAAAVRNATNGGLLASVSRGKKQLSAMGEQFVQELPDRDEAMALVRRKRKRRTNVPKRKRKVSKRESEHR